MDVAAVDLHGEDLIAAAAAARGLEDQPGAVGREIRLGVLAAEGELPDVAEMALGGRLRGGRAEAGRGNY
jgi:hypothetical protein